MKNTEFTSAYDKLALSPQFKAKARAKLTENFGELNESIAANIVEEHSEQMKSFALSTEKKPRRNIFIGAGAAAAVVALGIWGASALRSDPSPIGPQTTEAGSATETQDTDEPWQYIFETYESAEAVTPEETLNVNLHTFPSYLDNLTPYTRDILEIIPFDVAIDLPTDWHLSEPDDDFTGGFAPINIVDGEDKVVAVMDYCTYDIYPEAVGQPNYYRAVYNQLMMGSMVSWDCEYTPVAKTKCSENATCQIMQYDRDAGVTTYSDGILAYNDELRCYVNISFSQDISDELQRDIAKSITLSGNITERAEEIGNAAYSHFINFYDGTLPDNICVNAITHGNSGVKVIVSAPSDTADGCTLVLYELYGSKVQTVYHSIS